MTVIDDTERDGGRTPATPEVAPAPPEREPRSGGFYTQRLFAAIAILFVAFLLVTEQKARSTLITVVVAVAASASIWIGANMLFNQVRNHWQRFNALLYFTVTLVVTAILSGNRVIGNVPADDPVTKFVNRTVNGIRPGTLTSEGFLPEFIAWIWMPLVLSIGAGIVGFLLSRTDRTGPRLAIGAGGLGLLGVIAGASFNYLARPEIEPVALIGWTALGAGIAAGLGTLRKQELIRPSLLGAALGWVVGAFGAPDVGGGPAGWTVVAVAVPPTLIGIRAAIQPNLALRERGMIDNNSRKWIFLAPAMLFTFAMLVVPTISTIWLSFKDRDGEEFVKLDNYINIFQNENSWDPPDDWKDIFSLNFFSTSTGGSMLMILGLLVLAVFVVVGFRQKQRTGKTVELGSPSMGPLIIGSLLVLLAVVTTFRGTIVNNLWWVVIVTLASTAIGLAIAVLADGVRFEKVAKSIIFMPMAISLVGASVIWRFMYVARDSSKEQTGVLNGMWVGLGRLSTGQSIASVVFIVLIGLAALALMVRFATRRDTLGLIAAVATPFVAFAVMRGFAWLWGGQMSGSLQKWIIGIFAVAAFTAILANAGRQLTLRNWGGAALSIVGTVLVGWFGLRYFAVWGGGVGGQEINTVGNLKSSPINFVQESPFNSMFLMVVLIWIQTGFAMVILSAAIKAVPTELIEAAKVDGATDSQVFWRITLPQIAPTIGVVVTTIIVLVMKVYDIVNVMTNGNFETDILANQMFTEAFSFRDQGRGAALAILIFVSVLPVMIFNIRKMQREN